MTGLPPAGGHGGDGPMAGLPPPGAHGGDGPAVAAWLGVSADGILDLSASLNPVAPDPVLVAGRHLSAIRRYPTPGGTARATRALAGAIGVAPERLLLTNGGAEAIALVAAEIGGSVAEPDFGLYPRGGGPRWQSNPHNPSGLLADASARPAVWDEAFYPLATGQWTRGDDGPVVVGSLTKLFACPGLRLGYLLADPGFVLRCRERQPAWAVNGLAVEMLPELIALADLVSWQRQVAALRGELETVLRRHGLEPRPSQASWLLVDAPGLRARLAPAGIVVRDCTSFGMPGVMRIAVPGEAGIARLAEALDRTAGPAEPAGFTKRHSERQGNE
ncbi:MAG TPA: aminotransferase class I/II-fold pyridoxal phosphate-dependent enzyme [Streptosporangiaceae bacterium]